MTIISEDRKAGPFAGDGVTTTFPFDFVVYAKAHLRVAVANADGERELTVDSDYDAELNANQADNPGGLIQYPRPGSSGSPLQKGEILVITTAAPEVQTAEFTNMGGFRPQTVEQRLDYLTVLVQQLVERMKRVPEAGITDTSDLSLGTPAQRANSFLFFGPAGTLEFVAGITDQVAIASTVTVRIPTDFPTLQAAIDAYSARPHKQGARIILLIESGHRPSSGVLVQEGDYRHFWISSEDPEVKIADDFEGDFCRGIGAGMPTLDTVVDMGWKGANGYYVSSGSLAVIRPGCGVKNAVLYTLDVTGNSYVQAEGAVFDGSAHTRNVHVTHGSILNILNGYVLNSANIGLYCSHGGTIAAYGVTIDGAGAAGAQANQGGYMDLFQAVIRNAGTGIHSRHGANVSAQLAQVSDVQDGLIAQGSSSIAFDKGTVTGTISSDSIRCVDGSRVDAGEALLSGAGRYCAYAAHNSFIGLRQAKCNDAGEYGIYAYGGSTIAADLAEANRAGDRGVYAHGSYIFFRNGEADDAAGYGIYAANGATVNAEGASANNAGDHGIFANVASTINAQGATANNPTNNGFYAYRASTLNCEGGTSSGAGGNSVVAREGSKINCALANVQKGADPDTGATSADIRVREGSIINARGATGGLSQTENNLTAHGIIFR